MNRTYKNIFMIAFVVGLIFVCRNSLSGVIAQTRDYYFPCSSPILYSLGTFDTKFGISKEDFLSAMTLAEAIWEKPSGKDLFKYDPKGSLKVNLIYDTRQASTNKLKDIGSSMSGSRAVYEDLRTRYIQMNSDYLSLKSAYDSRVANFNTRKSAYETKVASINSKGGADQKTLGVLNTERNYLNSESVSINQLQATLNSNVNDINAMVSRLNDLATTLNINVKQYNTIGASLGGEFDEGIYKSGPDGREIDIYQFDSKAKLVRVMAHELGHALGLDHVDDPKAIMYRLNNGVNEKLTDSDMSGLRTRCNLPTSVTVK